MKNIFLVCLTLFLIGAIASCKKLDDGAEDSLTEITLADTATLRVGDIYQVPVSVTPSNYSKISLVWKSADTTVLSISNIGVATAKKVGKSIVTVSNKSGAISMSCLVTVVAKIVPVDSLKVGLIAHYAFNNSGVDSSGKGNHGAINNITSTSDRFGNANKAYYFNGTTSYVVVNDNSELRLSNTDITVSAWVKLDSYSNSYGYNILAKHLTGNDNGWAWGVTGNLASSLGVVTYGPGGTSAAARGNKMIVTNAWHMVTSTYNLAAKQLSVYVDGELDSITNNIPPPTPVASKLYIGRDEPTASIDGYVVKGSLDEVRIYNRLLSPTTIKKLYAYKN